MAGMAQAKPRLGHQPARVSLESIVYTLTASTPRKRATLSTAPARSPGVAAEWWFAPARHQRDQASTAGPLPNRNAAYGVPTPGQPVPVNSPGATTKR